MSQSRYAWLERQLDRENLTDAEFKEFNDELNELQEKKNQRSKEQEEKRLARIKEEEDQAEIDYINNLTEEAVEQMYQDACIKYQDVNGVSFKDWYQKSLTYYTIDDKFNVISKARSKNTQEVVPCQNYAHAKLRILTLIKTKFYDHAHRGYDFAWE